MSDVNSERRKEKTKVGDQLLPRDTTNDPGVRQLEFSHKVYTEIFYGNYGNPWLKIAADVARWKREQEREDNGTKQEEPKQISFFGKRERHDV